MNSTALLFSQCLEGEVDSCPRTLVQSGFMPMILVQSKYNCPNQILNLAIRLHAFPISLKLNHTK